MGMKTKLIKAGILIGIGVVLSNKMDEAKESGEKNLVSYLIKSEATSHSYDKHKVIHVADGDTFTIMYKGKKKSVRLIGIDTPESVHRNAKRNTKWGKIASDYTKNKLSGKTVYLRYDVQKEDQYGRLLAYVYTLQNGKYVQYNKTLVKKGYARAACYEPNHKYKQIYDKWEKDAKKKKKGFWKDGFKRAFPTLSK